MAILLWITANLADGLVSSKVRPGYKWRNVKMSSTNVVSAIKAPFDDIIPFLSEHIQKADQMLFVGASTDMALQLASAGYGKEKTGFLTVVDSVEENIEYLKKMAKENDDLSGMIDEGRLNFIVSDLANLSEVCKQSIFDSIVDYGWLDSILLGPGGKGDMLVAIDHLQNAVRLGNILVCLSSLEKETFCAPFEGRFGKLLCITIDCITAVLFIFTFCIAGL